MTQGSFVPTIQLRDPVDPGADVFAFQGRRLLVHEDKDKARVPTVAELSSISEPRRRLFLGHLAGRQVFAAELAPESPSANSESLPDGMAFRGLRALYTRLDDTDFNIAGRAIQLVDWDRDHQYCGRCGGASENHREERSKRCPSCGLVSYPRLSPAAIVLVSRGPEMLLARSPHFPPGMYSTLAGFVEAGETLEETVVREIQEEVGVLVGDIRYFGSQPWPFPNSLMVGFHARYLSGEITPEEGEIEDAQWFTADALPLIPPKISIARALIDAFVRGSSL